MVRARSRERDDRAAEEAEKQRLMSAPYFHGTLPRNVSERILQNNGEFLIRINEKGEQKSFALSVRRDADVNHFKVDRTSSGQWYVRKDVHRQTIKELIQHHMDTATPVARPTSDFGTLRLITPVGKERWEMKPRDVNKVRMIGKGEFGEVWLARCRRNIPDNAINNGGIPQGTDVAVKFCQSSGAADLRTRFKREAMFQLRFSHPNIVKLIGVVVSDEPMMIVLEYLSNGSLHTHLTRTRDYDVIRFHKYALDAAKGLAYLESLKLIHRDVAARNCLVSAREVVKISDFGLAKASEMYKMHLGKVAVRWMAPESMSRGEYTVKSDIWSFGVLVWEIFSRGAEPYTGLNNDQIKRRVLGQNYRLSFPIRTPSPVVTIVNQCWEKDPRKRPSFVWIVEKLEEARLSGSTGEGTTRTPNTASTPRTHTNTNTTTTTTTITTTPTASL